MDEAWEERRATANRFTGTMQRAPIGRWRTRLRAHARLCGARQRSKAHAADGYGDADAASRPATARRLVDGDAQLRFLSISAASLTLEAT